MDDRRASEMFITGRAKFHPHAYSHHWSPTAAPLSGRLIISTEELARLSSQLGFITPSHTSEPAETENVQNLKGMTTSVESIPGKQFNDTKTQLSQPDHCVSESLRPAPVAEIDDAIKLVYDEAQKAGMKPPNIREIVEPTQKKLRAKGFQASGERIRNAAQPYKGRRWPVGARWRR